MIVHDQSQKFLKEKQVQFDHCQALFNCLIKYIILLRKNYFDTCSISIDNDMVKFMVGLIHEILIFPNKKKTPYWNIFSSCCCNELSIKYINTIDELSTPQEKGMGWIILEFSEKKLDKIFQKISCNETIYSFFLEQENHLIINNRHNIITALQQLKNIEYQIESKLIDNFRNFCKNAPHYDFTEEILCFKTEPVYTDTIDSIKVNHTIIRRVSNKSPTSIELLNKKMRSPSYSPMIKKSSMKEVTVSSFKKKNSYKLEIVKKFMETRKKLLGKFKENIQVLKSYHGLVVKEFGSDNILSQRNSDNTRTSICNTGQKDGTILEIKLQSVSYDNSNDLSEFDTFNKKNQKEEEISSDRMIEEKGNKIRRDNLHLRKQSSTMDLMKFGEFNDNPNPISLAKCDENSDEQIQQRSLSDAYKHNSDPFNTPNFNRQALFGIKKIVTFSEDRKDRTYTSTHNEINNNTTNNKPKMEIPKISFTIDSKNQNNTFTSTDADTNSFNFIYLGEANKIESTPKILIKKDCDNNFSPPIKSVYSAGQMDKYFDNNKNHHNLPHDKFSYINAANNEFVLEDEFDQAKNTEIDHSPDSKSSRSLLLIKIRNSDLLQEEMEREKWFSLTYDKKENLKVRPEDSLSRCDQCHKDLKKKFYFLWIDAFQCPYSGQWYCYECMAPRKRALPWNVLENFDFTEVSVSKKADSILEERFKLPIMRIHHKDKIVAQNLNLYNCLILKRQIRLMFDFICHPQLMRDILGDYLNFALRKKRFSMQNLYEVKSGRLISKLEQMVKETQNHINECENCFKRGVKCAFCSSEVAIFRFDLRGTSVCRQRKCRKVYHKLCFDRIKECLCQTK